MIFLPFSTASGIQHMAFDEWLLEQHRQNQQPTTLRFYTWHPATISLGYHQRKFPTHWHNLSWQGKPVDLVRRPTGGRAVLHQGDLTYMVVTSKPPGKLLDVYQYICQFLIQGWRSLGVDLHYGEKGRGYIGNPNCFATATGADLVTSEGQKLIGSAQLRRGNVVLQHGSMILNPDPQLFEQVFGQKINPPQLNFSQASIIEALTKAARDIFNQ
ncbi:MAG: lipoate--protein ligase family protein [Spirulinaceae cyanobacterium]